MRVAYITRAPFISGAERSLQTLLRAAPQAGIEPVVICPADSEFVAWCKDEHIAISTCPLAFRDRWHPIRWLRSVHRMRDWLSELDVDVVHSNQVWSYQAAGTAAGERGIARVCHMRDEVDPEALRWSLSAGVEAIVCISRFIEQQVEAAWPDDVERPWIGSLMNPVAGFDGHCSKMPGDEIVFGFIGQITSVKGLSVLLDALAQLPRDAGWRLLVAGRDPNPGAPHEVECRKRAKELRLTDHVEFLGFVDEVSQFYRRIDLAVVPSLSEPLGRVPLEAGMAGVPSIASDAGGLPETIVDGQTGWLVPAGDADALAGALLRFLQTPEREAGTRARDWASEQCDPVRHVAALREIYETILARAGQASQPVGTTLVSDSKAG